MTKKKYYSLILILGSLTALAPFSIDTYLPGFPDIAKSFGIPVGEVTLSLSAFFLGIAFGQVPYGPFVERYGRKKPLYVGLTTYLIATVGCFLSPSIELLIGFRFLQAVGACAASVVSMVMVRDLFSTEENVKIFALLMVVLGASPMLAPTIGSLISLAYGWRGIFDALFMLALLILVASHLLLPESKSSDPSHSLSPKNIAAAFGKILKVRTFLIYGLGGGISLSGLFAYIADSSSIFMLGFGVSNQTYGILFALVTLGFIALSQFNSLLSKYLKPAQIVFYASLLQFLLSTKFFLLAHDQLLCVTGTACMIFLILGCIGVINPNAASLTLAAFKENNGPAASLYGLIQWGIAGLVSILVSRFSGHSATPLAILLMASAFAAIWIFYLGLKPKRNSDRLPEI